MGKDVELELGVDELEKIRLAVLLQHSSQIKCLEISWARKVGVKVKTRISFIVALGHLKESPPEKEVEEAEEEALALHHQQSCSHINTQMLPSKISYFFKLAKFAFTEYTILFYVSVGLSPVEAGLVNALYHVGGMIAAPLWGLIADKLKIHRFLCTVLGVIALLTTLCQPLLTVQLGEGNSCKIPSANGTKKVVHPGSSSDRHTKLYQSLIASSIISSFFDGGVMNFVDSGVMCTVKASHTKCEYGQQRYIGAFGSALGSLSMGVSITYFPQAYMSCYNGIFVTYTIFSVALLISCNYLLKRSFPRAKGSSGLKKFRGSVEKNLVTKKDSRTTCASDLCITIDTKNQKRPSENKEKDKEHRAKRLLMKTLKSVDTIVFLINVLFNGVVQALSFTLAYLFLQDMNAPTLLFGVSMSLCSLTSACVYYRSKKLISWFGGTTTNAMAVSCFFWSVRCLAVAFIYNPYYILLADIFHPVTYSLFYISAMEHTQAISHPATITTMTGIVNSLYTYSSFAVASVVGGGIYQMYGGRKLFIGTSIACFLWSCFMFVYIRLKNKYQKRKYVGKGVPEEEVNDALVERDRVETERAEEVREIEQEEGEELEERESSKD